MPEVCHHAVPLFSIQNTSTESSKARQLEKAFNAISTTLHDIIRIAMEQKQLLSFSSTYPSTFPIMCDKWHMSFIMLVTKTFEKCDSELALIIVRLSNTLNKLELLLQKQYRFIKITGRYLTSSSKNLNYWIFSKEHYS